MADIKEEEQVPDTHEEEEEEEDMPERYTEDEVAIVKCGTSEGDFALKLYRLWAPIGYDRAVMLFEKGFYDNSHFFVLAKNFLVEFGISYNKKFRGIMKRKIKDDSDLPSYPYDGPIAFEEGIVSFMAMSGSSGHNGRTTHLFIAMRDTKNTWIGKAPHEVPIGRVIDGIETVYKIGDFEAAPDQQRLMTEGEQYVTDNFPDLPRINECSVQRFKNGVIVPPAPGLLVAIFLRNPLFRKIGQLFMMLLKLLPGGK
jgi:peptidyl-prolyl cis-trans isomerase A (cyclophilin A)